MARLAPMRIGDVEVWVETTAVAGSEETGAGFDRAREKVVDAYERAQSTIVEVASTTVDMVGRLATRSARPDQLEVEFALKFAANGNVIVAGASADATLCVRLVYMSDSRTAPPAEAPSPPGG
ncbi:CU044_2847 family protein [Streptomyces sp. NPDC055287]